MMLLASEVVNLNWRFLASVKTSTLEIGRSLVGISVENAYEVFCYHSLLEMNDIGTNSPIKTVHMRTIVMLKLEKTKSG